jgi:hypothetical protein
MNKTMERQPRKHLSRRPWARRWRTPLLWAGALAALALAGWIATYAVYDVMSG